MYHIHIQVYEGNIESFHSTYSKVKYHKVLFSKGINYVVLVTLGIVDPT